MHPYPGPTGIRSAPYHGFAECTYCGFCGWTGCWTGAKASTNLHFIPQAEKTGNLKIEDLARVLEVNVDKDGRASGVTYLKGGRTHFQPAKVVILAGYIYENTRLLLLSTSKAYPHGLSNNHGQVGQNYMGHGLASASVTGRVQGQKLNLYSGTIGQYTAVDNWDADNFDHSGLGFISGGMVSATMESKPINGTANTIPPGRPDVGIGLQGVARRELDSVGSISAQVETLSYPQNYCDLDPVVKDDLGRPVLRITFALQQNEINAALWLQEKIKPWMEAAGASDIWTYPAHRIFAEHARIRNDAHGQRSGHVSARPMADLARGAQPARSRWRGVPDDDRAQSDRVDPGDVVEGWRPPRQALSWRSPT